MCPDRNPRLYDVACGVACVFAVTQKDDVPIRLGVQAFFIVPSLVAGILG